MTSEQHPATQSRFANRRDVNDVGAVTEGLWPDLPQVDPKDLLGKIFAVEEYRSIANARWNSAYQIMKCADADGTLFTTATSGAVVARKLAEIAEKGKFPVVCVMWQSQSAGAGLSGYYDLHSMAQEPDAVDFVYSG